MVVYDVNDEGEAVGSVPYRTVSGERRFTAKATAVGQVLGYASITPPVPGPVSLDNTYLANRTRSIWLHSSLFNVFAGTPDPALRSSFYWAYAFDATADEAIIASFQLPTDFVSFGAVNLVWTNGGAGSGNVVLRVGLNNTGDTGSLAALTASNVTVAAPVKDTDKTTSHTQGLPNTALAGQIVTVTVGRVGSDGADTLANDAWFYGASITYTADM